MSKNANKQDDKANPAKGLGSKIAELDRQIDWFYGSDFALDEATAHYREALKLAKTIEADLKSLKNEVEVLSRDFSQE